MSDYTGGTVGRLQKLTYADGTSAVGRDLPRVSPGGAAIVSVVPVDDADERRLGDDGLPVTGFGRHVDESPEGEPVAETRYYADGTHQTGHDLPDESPNGAKVTHSEPAHQAGPIVSQTPTSALRMFEGELQQLWNIVRRHAGGESAAHDEWRDIPEHVEPEPEPETPATGQTWDAAHRAALDRQNAAARETGAPVADTRRDPREQPVVQGEPWSGERPIDPQPYPEDGAA
jgi:hypothetical protein